MVTLTFTLFSSGREIERQQPRCSPANPLSVVTARVWRVITGELKGKVDRVWDAFWSGGISNPLEVIQQITYLLFLRRLDDLQTLEEKKSRVTGQPITQAFFAGNEQHLRWGQFKQLEPGAMFDVVGLEVFPYLRDLGTRVAGATSTYAEHLRDARFAIPTPALLAKVVDMLDTIPMADRDTNGDLYEYLLSKLASAGVNGQFRTPRHIIQLMVQLMDPKPGDEICDPACGTAGFLVAASEHVREQHPDAMLDAAQRTHFHRSMFHGYDFDSTMLRIASMNMLMHGIESPDIRYRDSLSEGASGEADKYTLILANPPFAGSLDYESTSKELLATVKTRKTELLFLALFLKLLQPGGRAAVIVPDGVLFGSTKAHKDLRRSLVEDHKLDAVIKLPSGVFRPYAGVSTAILIFTKTGAGGTDQVWFYDVQADGFSLDDKRNPVTANDLPEVATRWSGRDTTERDRTRTEQSFTVPKEEIAAQSYDLSLNRYKEIVHDDVEHRDPLDIIADLEQLEAEITTGLAELKAMLS
jgi:type I restriction enzyme M protein